MVFQHFRCWAHPARKCMHHTCRSCLEAHLFPFCSFSATFSTKKRSFSASPWHSWNPLPPFDPSKSSGKTNGFSTFSPFGPTKPPHICIILAISCLEAHLFSDLLLFWSLFQPNTVFSSTFSTLGMFLPLCPPQKTFKNQWFLKVFIPETLKTQRFLLLFG